MMVFYVYVPFDVLPIVGFRNDFAIEGGSGVRHLQCFLVSLSCCSFFRYDSLKVSGRKAAGTRGGL